MQRISLTWQELFIHSFFLPRHWSHWNSHHQPHDGPRWCLLLSRYNPTVISNEKEFNYFRSLSAFNVGLFGEARAYTTRKVTNHPSYIAKCDFFNTSYTPDLRPHANFILGFMFSEIPGAMLKVIGIMNPNAQAQHAQEIQASERLFATQFFLLVLHWWTTP